MLFAQRHAPYLGIQIQPPSPHLTPRLTPVTVDLSASSGGRGDVEDVIDRAYLQAKLHILVATC